MCPDDVVLALGPDTRLVSLMLANNETGIIQPVGGVVKAVREWEGQGSQRQRVLVHTDAAQVKTMSVFAVSSEALIILGIREDSCQCQGTRS